MDWRHELFEFADWAGSEVQERRHVNEASHKRCPCGENVAVINLPALDEQHSGALESGNCG